MRFRLNETAELPGSGSIVDQDADFFLIPDLAPLVEGHLLLVTRAHYVCAGALPDRLWRSAGRWRDRVFALYRALDSRAAPIAFEHGPARSQGAGACIDHAHWHLLPRAPEMNAVVSGAGLTGTPLTPAALRELHAAGESYLAVGATLYPVGAERTLHAQFLRWAALTALSGTPPQVWRWQEMFGLPESRRRFLRTLSECRALSDGALGTTALGATLRGFGRRRFPP